MEHHRKSHHREHQRRSHEQHASERRGHGHEDSPPPSPTQASASATERSKGQKRKPSDNDAMMTKRSKKLAPDGRISSLSSSSLRSDIRGHVDILKRCFNSSSKGDRGAALRAADALAELAVQEENFATLVDEGVIGALVPHLRAPIPLDKDGTVPYEHEVEKYAAYAIGRLATKHEYQNLIVEGGALSYLVTLLYRKAKGEDARVVNSTIRRAVETITNLARDNSSIQKRLKMEGVVSPLEALVESTDRKVHLAAEDALRILAIRKEEEKVQLHETNGSKGAANLDGHQHYASIQGVKKAEPGGMVIENNNSEDSSKKDAKSSGLKGLSLKSPEALAKAKLALEKQKLLAEKLKKIPQVGKGAAQTSSGSISSVLPEASVTARVVSQTTNVGKFGVPSSGGTQLSTSAMSAGVPNIGLPNLPGMSPLASVETLKKVQEITARLGIPQTTESIPFLSMIQRHASEPVAAGQHKDMKGPVLRLDALGREIDEHGNLVERTKISNLSTLKVNINKHKKESFQILHPELEEEPINNRFYDPDLGVDKKKLVRLKRPNFQFVQEGSFAKQAEISRMRNRFGDAQAKEIKMKQAALAKAKAEADINPNLIEVSERFVTKVKPKDPIPDVEWWDVVLLPSGNYQDVTEGDLKLKMEKLTIYVEHPVPVEPPAEPAPPPPQPLKLTKKEQKKLRTQRRLAREKDRQEMIRQGLLEPPKSKVKMSNLMKVLGAEATQDPTKLEMEIRTAAAEREQAHTDRNLARKLTPAERRKKKERKLFDDPNTLETIVSVYKVNDLSHVQTRFKVDVNAQENRLTGCIVTCDTMTLIIVEGGSKPIKRYNKLMLQRIKWATAVKESDDADVEHPQQVNRCVLVWQGSVAKPMFEKFTAQQCRTEAAARKYLVDAGVGHYWDLAANFTEE